MTSNPILDTLPPHISDFLKNTSTTQLAGLAVIDALRQIYSLSLAEGPQRDALICALEAHSGAAQVEIIEQILRTLRLRDPASHFIISTLGQRISWRTANNLSRLKTLLTMFPE